MKKFYSCVIAVVMFILSFNNASAQIWQWARSGNGFNGFAEGLAVCTDTGGNAVVSGFFQSPTIVFGTFTLTNPGSSAGDTKVFIVKYSPAGTVLWARAATGTGTQEGRGICADASGNIYACGYFSGPSITFGSTTLVNAGGGNAYLVKYDANGNVLWGKCSSASQGCVGQSVTVDINGNVLLNGWFTGASAAFGTYTLTQTGTVNVFLTKYDANGNVLWAKKSVGSGSHFSFSVCSDMGGNSYITGGFSGPTVVFGTFTLSCTGTDDIFVVKYDPNGNPLWARRAGGSGTEKGQAVSEDGNGNVYVTGYFSSPTMSLGSFNLTNTGSNDVFVARYDSNGNELWAKSTIGTGNDYGYSAAAVASGVFVTGCMGTYGTANGGAPVTVGTFTLLPPSGATDPMYVAQYDLNGNVIYAKALGAGGDDVCAIAADKSCNVFISGDFYNLDPFIIGNDTLHLSGVESAFTAKLSYNLQLVVSSSNATVCAGQSATLTVSGANTYTWSNNTFTNSIVVTPSITTAYTVNGTSTLQCPTNSAAVNVFVKPSPSLTAQSSKPTICNGESAVLTASGASTYTWAQGGNNASVTINPTVSNTYTVTGSLLNGCSKTMTLAQVVNPCNDIQSPGKTNILISASPNPFSDLLNIRRVTEYSGELKIILTNSMGQVIEHLLLTGESLSIDFSELPEGMYFLNVFEYRDELRVLKVIKN